MQPSAGRANHERTPFGGAQASQVRGSTNSNHAFPVAHNVLNQKYQVENVSGLNRVWAGDITYVPTAQGWFYLAVVLDLKSRKVIGWSMRDSLEQTLVHEALEVALSQRLCAEVEGQRVEVSCSFTATAAANMTHMIFRRS